MFGRYMSPNGGAILHEDLSLLLTPVNAVSMCMVVKSITQNRKFAYAHERHWRCPSSSGIFAKKLSMSAVGRDLFNLFGMLLSSESTMDCTFTSWCIPDSSTLLSAEPRDLSVQEQSPSMTVHTQTRICLLPLLLWFRSNRFRWVLIWRSLSIRQIFVIR